MQSDRWERIQELFAQAAVLPPAEQTSFLTQACGDDAELLAEVTSLLEHDEQTSAIEAGRDVGVLAQMRDLLGAASPDGQRPPTNHDALPLNPISGYEIHEEIGRGGMGVVYRATQVATKRIVALKILLEGPFASTLARRWFEREVETAARLEHPYIVTVLQSGEEGGRHFFAMQFVKGQHLDAHLADKRPSLVETLRLFAKICDAVSYAHQKGVIHRDLKPSNILIDVEGNPHILDFGVAKLAGPDDLERTQLSITGHILGTLPYMSPEQAVGARKDIDIRTDVYSLGVILYQMLTGKYPYPVVGTMAEVLRNIAEAEPQRPSSWNKVAKHPKLAETPSRFRVNSELETIVLKTLAKERERRYQAASNLLDDIRRLLAGEPIEAKRDSALYVLRKLAVRHAYSTALLLCVFVILMSSAWIAAGFHRQAQTAQSSLESFSKQVVENTNEWQIGKGSFVLMGFGWFLENWRAGRTNRAGEIMDKMPAKSAERAAAAFLLDDNMPEEKLLENASCASQAPPSAAALAQFAIGERRAASGEIARAIQAFESSLNIGADQWLKAEAQARLEELRSRVTGTWGRLDSK